jgi:hypothetical protein
MKKCGNCGAPFERTEEYIKQDRTDPLFIWKLRYCDKCTDEKVNNAFKRMPEILKILSEDKNEKM